MTSTDRYNTSKNYLDNGNLENGEWKYSNLPVSISTTFPNLCS